MQNETEKLRALLAEARRLVGFLPTHPAGIDAVLEMQKRIDAALAEPVRDWQPHEPVERTEYVVKLERERDEARAEAETLRAALTCSESEFSHRCIRCDREVEP